MDLLNNLNEEPIFSNRWYMQFEGIDIPAQLVRNFRLNGSLDTSFLTVTFYQTLLRVYAPNDLFQIKGIKIIYVDPLGIETHMMELPVQTQSYEYGGDYANSELMTYSVIFNIETECIKLNQIETKNQTNEVH